LIDFISSIYSFSEDPINRPAISLKEVTSWLLTPKDFGYLSSLIVVKYDENARDILRIFMDVEYPPGTIAGTNVVFKRVMLDTSHLM
jgi:hypothetical protein